MVARRRPPKVPSPPYRSRSRRAAVLALVSLLTAGACSPLKGAASGSPCSSAIDCASGLGCIPVGSSSVCTADAAAAETQLDSGLPATPPPATDASTASDSASDAGEASTAEGGDAQPQTDGGSESSTPATDGASEPSDGSTVLSDAAADSG